MFSSTVWRLLCKSGLLSRIVRSRHSEETKYIFDFTLDTCTWIDFLTDESEKVGPTADVTDAGLDAFGMPTFDIPSVPPPIHKTPSAGSLLEEGSDKTISSSPALPRRRNTLPTTVSARDGFIKLHMADREKEFVNIVPFT